MAVAPAIEPTEPLATTPADNKGEGAPGGWLASLPEDLRGHADIKDLTGLDALAKAFVDLKAGQPVKPESADKYEIPVAKDLPVNDVTTGLIAAFRGAAFQAGLTNDQAKAVAEGYNTFAAGQISAQAKAQQDDAQALKTEWGARYEENLATADKGVVWIETAYPGFKAYLETSGLVKNTGLMRAFHIVGKALAESALPDGKPQKPAGRPVDAAGNPRLKFPSMGDK